ncbi:hypothetical protein LMG33810_000064 [Carnimonas sp. LMG 33810]
MVYVCPSDRGDGCPIDPFSLSTGLGVKRIVFHEVVEVKQNSRAALLFKLCDSGGMNAMLPTQVGRGSEIL